MRQAAAADAQTGDIRVEIKGEGTGPLPHLNNMLGLVFLRPAYKAMWEHMK